MAYKPAPKRDENESRLLKENESSLPLLKTNFILMAIAGILMWQAFA